MGYTTGQCAKNHLDDLNQFLPTVHDFDEYFGRGKPEVSVVRPNRRE